MGYWIVKSEPNTYSFFDLQKDKTTVWDGVRNYAARNHLRQMKLDDWVLVYHSGDDKAVFGVSQVAKEAFPDPTTNESAWVAVSLKVHKALKTPVTLKTLKSTPELSDLILIRQSRLSVSPITAKQYETILLLGKGLL